MKIFPYVHEHKYELLQITIAERNRDLVNLDNELQAMRASLKGAEIANAKDVFTLRERLLNAERTAATAVSMAAEKQKEIAALRAQIVELMAAHKEQVGRSDTRVEKLMDWIAKGYTGVPIFDKPEAPAVEPVAEAPKPADPMKDVVETDMEEAFRVAGPRARSISRFLTLKADAKYNDEQLSVRETFKQDKIDGEVAAVVAVEKTT